MGAQLSYLPFLAANLPVSDFEIAVNHARLSGIGWGLAIVGVALGLLWAVWQYQAHDNLRALRVGRPRFAPVAGVLAWLIPVANLVVPVLAVRELWRVGDPDVTGPDGIRRTGPLVWIWWLLLLAGIGLALRGFSLVPKTVATPEQLISRNHWLIAASLVGIPSAVVSIVLVNRITARLLLKEDQVRYPGWKAWSSRHRGPAAAPRSPGDR